MPSRRGLGRTGAGAHKLGDDHRMMIEYRPMTHPTKDSPGRSAPDRDAAPERFDASALFKTSREIILVHNGEDYRLRVTAKGKLILTK